MSIVRTHENSEAGIPPSQELMVAIGKLAEEMTKAGKLLDTGGLLPSSKGARLQLSGGKVTVTDGPFTEAKELIGGYAIFQVKSKEEMIELGKRFLQVHADAGGPSYETALEIRQVFDPSDLAPGER